MTALLIDGERANPLFYVRVPDVQTSAQSSVFTLFTVIKCARSPELIFVRLFGSPVNNHTVPLSRGGSRSVARTSVVYSARAPLAALSLHLSLPLLFMIFRVSARCVRRRLVRCRVQTRLLRALSSSSPNVAVTFAFASFTFAMSASTSQCSVPTESAWTRRKCASDKRAAYDVHSSLVQRFAYARSPSRSPFLRTRNTQHTTRNSDVLYSHSDSDERRARQFTLLRNTKVLPYEDCEGAARGSVDSIGLGLKRFPLCVCVITGARSLRVC